MESIRFDELRQKEVINIRDCTRLGFINDAQIDISCGKITAFIVREEKCLVFGKANEYVVPWECITKIGTDIIFVDVCLPDKQCPPPKKEKRRFW